jgi:hypothetical protein
MIGVLMIKVREHNGLPRSRTLVKRKIGRVLSLKNELAAAETANDSTHAGPRTRRRPNGQSTVEFALAISVFMSVLLVGFQFGIIAMQQYSLQHTTRHTARWLAVNPDTNESASPDPILQHAKANALSLNPNLITSVVPDPICNWGGSPARCQNRISSGAVKVTINYNIAPQLVLPPAMLDFFKVPTTLQSYAVSIMIE